MDFGHGRHIGQFGADTFCPSVEGKEYLSKEVWLEARKKEKPSKEEQKVNDNLLPQYYCSTVYNYYCSVLWTHCGPMLALPTIQSGLSCCCQLAHGE